MPFRCQTALTLKKITCKLTPTKYLNKLIKHYSHVGDSLVHYWADTVEAEVISLQIKASLPSRVTAICPFPETVRLL